MKKARILLTAVAVFAVVGGAVAYKAKTFGPLSLFTIDASGQCKRVGLVITPGTQLQAQKATVTASNAVTTSPAICTSTFFYNPE